MSKKKLTPLVISVVVFSMILAFTLEYARSNSIFEVEQITENAVDDFCVTIDLDSAGDPHIAWVNTEGAYYAFRSDDSWTINPIITDPPLKGSTEQHFGPEMMRMRLDSQEHPHIAWAKPSSGYPTGDQVFYSYWNGTNWITEQVTHWGGSITQLHNVRLALDSQDQPHIVWDSRIGLWGVFYSETNEFGWTFETISHSDDFNPNIAIDSNDIPHVIWQDGGQGLGLSYRVGENDWDTTQIVDEPASGSLAFDSLDNYHIALIKGPYPYRLFYGTNSSGLWEFVEVADGDYQNIYVNIAVDANDVPNLVWSRDVTGVLDIYYASSQLGWILRKVSDQPLDEVWPKTAICDSGTIHLVWNGPNIWTQQGGSEIYYARMLKSTSATVDIDPDTLNLKSKGEWVTAYIELPEGYDVADIDVSTILLNDTIPPELYPTDIGDYDGDGNPDLMVKFDRAEVIEYILANINMIELAEERFMTTTLTITGYLNDNTPFQGSDIIRIMMLVPRGHGRIFAIFPL